MRNTRREFSFSLKTFTIFALLFAAIAAGTGGARAHDAHDAVPAAVRAEGEDLTQGLVRLDAERRRGGARAATLAQQMRDAAAKRADLLADLIADNPAEVLRLELPARLQARMPADVQAMLEQRVEIEGRLEILHVDADDPAQDRHLYALVTDLGERFSLHFAAGAPELVTGTQVNVRGLLLPRPAKKDGEPDGALAIASSDSDLEVLALGGTTSGTPSSGLTNTFGEQRTVVLLVNFQDNPSNKPWTTTDVSSLVNGTVSDFFEENSYQQSWLNADVFGWYTLPLNSTSCVIGDISLAAQQAATNAGINLSLYTRYVYAFPANSTCGWSGVGTVGGTPSKAWINGKLQWNTYSHELGHNLGLYHSHGLDCGATTLGSSCTTIDYGFYGDIMGTGVAGHLNAYQKDRLGWLGYDLSPPVTDVQASGTYSISPLEPVGNSPRALKVLKSIDPVTAKRTWFYIEYRQAIGFDAPLATFTGSNYLDGVIVSTGSESGGNTSNELDMTPATDSLFANGALGAGLSFTDSAAGVTMTHNSENGTQASVTVTLATSTCQPANPQVAVSPSQSQWVAPGTPVAYTVTVTNKDGTACANATFALTNAVPSGWTGTYDSTSLTLAAGASSSRTLTVTSPLSAADGFYTVTATAKNGTSYSGSTTATYVVSNPTANQPPVANNDSAATDSGKSVIIPVLANDSDPDGDALKVASATQGGGGTVVVNVDNTLTYTAAATFSGTDSFSYSASDGRGGSDTAVVTVTVAAANTPPVAVNDSAATQSGKPVIIPVLANDTDPDGDALKVASATQGGGGTVVVNVDNTLTYTAAATFSGTDSFSYSASDGRGGSDTAVVTVSVTAVNYPPTAGKDSASTHAGTPVSIAILANDSDANGDILTVTSTGAAKYGTVTVNPDKTVTYTPVAWYVGTDSFTYAIADGKGGTASATVTLTMTNTAAVAVNDSAATKAGVSVIVRVLANDYDPDRDPIYVKSVTQGAKGTVALNADNTVTYTPGSRFRGSDSFTYTIGDGRGGLCTATVTVTKLR